VARPVWQPSLRASSSPPARAGGRTSARPCICLCRYLYINARMRLPSPSSPTFLLRPVANSIADIVFGALHAACLLRPGLPGTARQGNPGLAHSQAVDDFIAFESSSYFKMRIVCPAPAAESVREREPRGHELPSRRVTESSRRGKSSCPARPGVCAATARTEGNPRWAPGIPICS
jgi:hypothetical protein